MKNLSRYIKESSRTVLYKKNEKEFEVPGELQNRRWTDVNWGRPGKKKYGDLKKAVGDVLRADRLSWSDIDTVTLDGDVVEVRYIFGKDRFGFSLKAV